MYASRRSTLIVRYRRKGEGLSPYVALSALIHLGLGLFLSATLLLNFQTPKELYTHIRLVDLSQPEPQVERSPKAPAKKETAPKTGKPQEVQPRSKPAKMAQAKLPAAPKVTVPQQSVQLAPQEAPKPPAQGNAPASIQPRSWSLTPPPLSPPPSSSTSSAQKLLSSESAQGSGARASSNLVAQLSERPQGEEVYRPSTPSASGSGPLPRQVGGTPGGGPQGRGVGRGPASGIDKLSAGSAAGAVGQVAPGANGEGTEEKGTGFRAPTRPISIGSPSRGRLEGLNEMAGGEKYIPLDSEDPDWGDYAAYLKERIKRFWHTPEGAETLKGSGELVLTLEQDGSLSRVRVLTSSGYRLLDQGILDAVNRAAPFRPFPEKIKEKRATFIGPFRYGKSGAGKSR